MVVMSRGEVLHYYPNSTIKHLEIRSGSINIIFNDDVDLKIMIGLDEYRRLRAYVTGLE